jgi:toxin ParE1/3/4
MRVRVTHDAHADLGQIRDYIAAQDAAAAARVLACIARVMRRLKLLPRLGHVGIVQGTYEIGVPQLPFLIVYRIDRADRADELIILRVYHTSRYR